MNRIVTMFIDYAEMQAEDGIVMSMNDWVDETNRFLEKGVQIVMLYDLERFKEYFPYTVIDDEVEYISKVIKI